MLQEEFLKKELNTSWAGKTVSWFDVTDSTNEEVKRLAEKGASHGTLVVADSQTAGKGRLGRSFVSPKGQGIWMSLLIKDQIEPAKASMLTLVMGLAVAKAIQEEAGVAPQIKWPNDVILSGKKVCGILTEMSLLGEQINYLVVGVGVNVGNCNFPEELQSVATSILLESGKVINRKSLLEKILQIFEDYYRVFMKSQTLSELKDLYNQYLINRNRQVRVLDPKGDYSGVAEGINNEGELIVETDCGKRNVSSGEVSVRGVLGYTI